MYVFRLSFFLLILLNLLFFTWSQGYFGQSEEGREPQHLTSQLSPEKLKVLSTEAPPPPSETATTAATAANTANDTLPLCRLITDLDLAEAQALHAKLSDKLPRLQTQFKALEKAPGYWIFMPPQGSQALADKKMAELKKLNIPSFTDFQIILEAGADQFSISLGIFEDETSAHTYLKNLAKYGVKSAKLQLRSRAADKAQIELHGNAALMQSLTTLTNLPLSECPLTEQNTPQTTANSGTPGNATASAPEKAPANPATPTPPAPPSTKKTP